MGIELLQKNAPDPGVTSQSECISNVVPYDENLLERSRTQWQFGDWQTLAQLERDTLQHHPDRAKLALLAAAGHAQMGDTEKARQFTRLARDWGCGKKLISQVLIAGVYNTLGKASAIAGQEERALAHFEDGVRLANSGGDVRLLTQARVQKQVVGLRNATSICLRLDSDSGPSQLFTLGLELQRHGCLEEADAVLGKAIRREPYNNVLLETFAENSMQLQNYTEAARRWQDVAEVLGPHTPQRIYTRMSDAYSLIADGWGGTEEENHCYGDRHKHDILSELHQKLQPKLYLEIGVDKGLSLARAQCDAIGVDPRPQLDLAEPLKENVQIISAGSDAFFRDQATEYLKIPPDIVFIDGMHLFEFALRDFMNVEKFASPTTLVAIDDVHPCHPTQALRRRQSNAWTGDIWKIPAILKEYRSDINIVDVDANTTGLLLIWGLNSKNNVLHENYKSIVNKYKKINKVPDSVLQRDGVISSDEGVQKVVDFLQQAAN
jgi:tetratricopeptide (TPR) repeat protein